MMDDLIIRQAAIELVDWYQHEFIECDYAFGELSNELSKLPSAQPSADVVEREDLDEITEAHEKIGYGKGFRDGYAQAMYQSEDMVQVVRCNDCKFWKTETEPVGIECKPGESAHYCELGGIWRSGDFCKYGHRKGDSDDSN